MTTPPKKLFNLALEFGPYQMRLIESQLVPGNAQLWADGKSPEVLVNASHTREQQFRAIWTYICQTFDRDLMDLISAGRARPEQAPYHLAGVVIAVVNGNRHLRSLKHFERACNDAPVQIIVPNHTEN